MAEWQETTADIFCASVRDGTHDSPKPTSRGQKLITSRHIVGGRIDLESAYLISDSDYEAINRRSRVDQWDVLITMIGTVGEPCLVRSPPDFAIKNIGLFKSKGELEGKWLYYCLRSNSTQQLIRELSAGTTQSYIALGALRKLRIRSPQNRREMEAIVSVLGALDDKIELNRRMNETLEAMARAIFKDWFIDFGPTRAKIEGRAPYLAPDIWSLFPDRLDDEGKPEGWQLRPVGDFAELRGGKQLEKERITNVGTIPVFGGAGVMGFTDGHNAEGFVISVGRVGAYCGQFFSHRGKAWINNNASLIQQNEGVSGEWLFQSLRHADIEVIKKGAAQPFVSNTDVGNMPIIWPGERAVARFADVAVPLMLRMEHNEAEVTSLATTRDFLLPKLMSGEVRVKDAEKLVGEAT